MCVGPYGGPRERGAVPAQGSVAAKKRQNMTETRKLDSRSFLTETRKLDCAETRN